MRSYCHKPAPPRCDFIENFWLYDGYESPALRERMLPSGSFEPVFNLREDELRIYKAADPQDCDRLSAAIVSGRYNGFFITDTAEEASVMGVQFKHGGAFPFLGVPADELADLHIALTIWGPALLKFANNCAPPRRPSNGLIYWKKRSWPAYFGR